MPTILKATLDDLPEILEIYNEAILTTTASFDTEVKTLEQQREWFDSHGPRHPILVAKLDGKIVGWISLSEWSGRCAYSETAESSIYVHSKYRGKGIGRKLKQAILDEAKRLGFHSIISRMSEESEASIYLNEQFGFFKVGTLKEVGRKFGKLLDVHIYQMILDEYHPPPIAF